MKSRPSLNDVFMSVAEIMSSRSTCIRDNVGCIIVKEGRIISSAYNGVSSGMPHCVETGECLKDVMSKEDYKICNHAEQNAICQCAKHGISTNESKLYVTGVPCMSCSKMIVSAGINFVYVSAESKDKPKDGVIFLERNGVLVESI